jgi:hypothetical protein
MLFSVLKGRITQNGKRDLGRTRVDGSLRPVQSSCTSSKILQQGRPRVSIRLFRTDGLFSFFHKPRVLWINSTHIASECCKLEEDTAVVPYSIEDETFQKLFVLWINLSMGGPLWMEFIHRNKTTRQCLRDESRHVVILAAISLMLCNWIVRAANVHLLLSFQDPFAVLCNSSLQDWKQHYLANSFAAEVMLGMNRLYCHGHPFRSCRT